MNCNRVQNLLSAFIDEELPAQDKRELRHHLFLCPECHSEYENLLAIKECLNDLNQEQCDYDPLVGFKLRIAAAEHSFFRETDRFLMLGRFGLVTGCVTLFFFSTIALFPNSSSKKQIARYVSYPEKQTSSANPITITPVNVSSKDNDPIDSIDQYFSLDEPVTVYQASSIIP
ncbi:MAG: zf-HC2 domain-containing protein [Firmicutes bacterium]|nr:zf-HC2 domain-containing protein [Bacillota bacterium]